MSNDRAQINSRADVRFMPMFSGNGYEYGGGAVLTIGKIAIPVGEDPDARELAEQIAKIWNDALLAAARQKDGAS